MKKYHAEKERKLAAFRATDKWRKKHMASMVMRLRNEEDADVIAKIESAPNKVGYIRTLVREDMKKPLTTENGWFKLKM